MLNFIQTDAPPLFLDQVPLDESRSVYVAREDLLPGGTKQRAVIPFLRDLVRGGAKRFYYASPFAGFAQVALARGCAELGLPCVIYAEEDRTRGGGNAHAFTKLAEASGARVYVRGSLGEAEAACAVEAGAVPGGYKIPLGFRAPEFQRYLRLALKGQVSEVQRRLGRFPKRVWLPVGSATLADAFLAVAPAGTEFACVNVHVLSGSDPRVRGLERDPRVRLLSAPEEFPEPAGVPPPLPSNVHYDAKLWRFLQAGAASGDLWWNVAR